MGQTTREEPPVSAAAHRRAAAGRGRHYGDERSTRRAHLRIRFGSPGQSALVIGRS